MIFKLTSDRKVGVVEALQHVEGSYAYLQREEEEDVVVRTPGHRDKLEKLEIICWFQTGACMAQGAPL